MYEYIILPTWNDSPTFYRLWNETADRSTVLDRSHSKLNSWLGLSGANDSSDVKLVHFLLFVCCDGFANRFREYRIRNEKNSLIRKRSYRSCHFSRIEKSHELNTRKLEFVRAICACACVCRQPRYPGKCQSTVVKRWIVACARACVRTRDPVLASRKHECEFSLPIRMTKFVPLIAYPLVNGI